jgi:DNA-binding transcriptional ArsR family regulator
MGSISLELTVEMVYGRPMAKEIHHPDRDQIDLSAVLEALSEPTRREIVIRLLEQGEAPCQAFDGYAPKTNLSYHYARLREAGVTRTRLAGPYRMISVRVDDLAARFPGLLDSVVKASRAPKSVTQEPADALGAPEPAPR